MISQVIQGCVFIPSECGTSCDWTNSNIWVQPCSPLGYPSNLNDNVNITAPGNYQITYTIAEDVELGAFQLGSTIDGESQVVRLIITGATFSVSNHTFFIHKSGTLSIEAQSDVSVVQSPPVIENGGTLLVGSKTSTLNLDFEGTMQVDGTLDVISLANSIPISEKVSFSSPISGNGILHTLNNTLVYFSSRSVLNTTNFQTDGKVYGYINFTGSYYLNNGIIGYETAGTGLNSNLSVSGVATLSSSSILNIVLQNETDHLIVSAKNITLGGSLVVFAGIDLNVIDQTTIPLITGQFQGNFSSTLLAFDSFTNRASCTYYIIYENIVNQVALTFLACDNIITSDGVLGYDKKTMIYFGIALGIAIVLIVIVACVIRRWKDCKERFRGRRNFYNLKDEEFFKDFEGEKD